MGGQNRLQLPWPLPLAPPPSLQDWWASTSFSSYYRKWNTLVHDWIYSYLFLDMRAVFPSKLPAILSTLFLSAFIHEYLLALGLGFASPVLMIEFAGLGGKMMSYWSHHVTITSTLSVSSCVLLHASLCLAQSGQPGCAGQPEPRDGQPHLLLHC